MDDKRISRRFAVRLIAHCRKARHDESYPQQFISSVKDLSSKGACITTPAVIQAGEDITLSLEIPAFFLPVVVRAKVIWAKRESLSANELYDVTNAGLRFVKAEKYDVEKILNFIARQEGATAYAK